MSRHLERFVVFALAALVAPACLAGQFTFNNGNFDVNVPANWSRIVYAPGNPESMVFQVPDPSPTSHDTLARVTVTSQRVRDILSFRQFVTENSRHAQALPGFHANHQSSAMDLRYTATEGSVQQTYVEHYYFHKGFAVMVRCVRPSQSDSGAAWIAAFDKGCSGVAADIK